jgi:hypothetical protein
MAKKTSKSKRSKISLLGGDPEEFLRSNVKRHRLRSQSHLSKVRGMPCVICGKLPSDPHHLRSVGHPHGAAIKNGDDFTIPLCRVHHEELHIFGSEKLFLDLHGIDALSILAEIKGEYNGED